MSQSPSPPIYITADLQAAPAGRAQGKRATAGNFIIRHPYRFKKCMSTSTEDDLGRRRFLIERDKAVEHALERIRRAPDSRWETLSPAERAGLKDVLNETWENCDRERWHEYCFSILAKTDILRLIYLGNDIKTRHHMTDETKAAVEAILLSCSMDDHPH